MGRRNSLVEDLLLLPPSISLFLAVLAYVGLHWIVPPLIPEFTWRESFVQASRTFAPFLGSFFIFTALFAGVIGGIREALS